MNEDCEGFLCPFVVNETHVGQVNFYTFTAGEDLKASVDIQPCEPS